MVDFRTVLDPADFRDEFDRSAIWQRWLSSNYPLHVVVDGVDEGVLKIGDFLPKIIQILTRLDPAVRVRLRLKLVCRTLEWARYQDSELQIAGLLKGDVSDREEGKSAKRHVYTLRPLTRDEVSLAVRESELDPESFFAAIFQANVAELAAYPFTLKMLLSEFASGLLQSQTRRTLYESYARALCRECYDHLRTAFPAVHAHLIPQSERIFFATELLAAVMVVTGRDLVQLSTGQLTSEACLRLEDILS